MEVNEPRPSLEIHPSCLGSPREGAGDVDLKAPRTSYGPRQRRVARRRERKLNLPRLVQKSDQTYPVRSRARADLPKPPQPIVALVPNVGFLREYCVANRVFPGRRAYPFRGVGVEFEWVLRSRIFDSCAISWNRIFPELPTCLHMRLIRVG